MQNVLFFTIKLAIVFIAIIATCYAGFRFYENNEYYKNIKPAFYDDGVCNIATVAISGNIGISTKNINTTDTEFSSGYQIYETGNVDYIIGKLDSAKNNPNILGVLLQVDSYGGYGSAGEILSTYISKYPKPVVSYVRDAAASAAYWTISPSDYIVANRTSDIGSIGATFSYVDISEKNKKEGILYKEINTGKYKDSGIPEKSLSEDERKYLQKNIDYLADVFKSDISRYRNIALPELNVIADGRVFQGDEAISLGLIDELGDETVALSWFDKNIFANEQKASQCYPVY